jgi:Tfp pilus assembly protein PilF
MGVDLVLHQAETALAAGDARESHRLCMEAIRLDPRSPEPFALLGLIAADHSNHPKALEVFDRALAIDPSHGRTLAWKAKSLLALQRFGEAADTARRGAASGPTEARVLDALGVVLARMGHHAEAQALFAQAVQAKPVQGAYHYNLGASLQFLGRFAEAEVAFRRAIDRSPQMTRAYAALVQLRRQTAEDGLVAPLQTLFEKAESAEERLHLGHALAKSYEDFGDLDTAWAWLLAAKAARRSAAQAREAADAALFAAAAKVRLASVGAGSSGVRPVFVFGLPRTGTTLIDRILSSHPAIVSAGELTDLGLAVKRAAGTPGRMVLDAATLEGTGAISAAEAGAAYLTSVTRAVGTAPIFIDKMPLNFFYARLIAQALPEAVMIGVRRGAMDSAVSNFRQLFATDYPYYDYAYDLGSTARYVAQYCALAEEWANTLPRHQYLDVWYEDVVADLEGQTKRMLDFLGLPFDPACLSFQDNAAPVSTASAVQVRQPLYSSSVGRWRRYGPGLLDEALRVFAEAGLEPTR